jgi:hypothetical protein
VVQALGPPVYVMPAGAEISKRPQPIIIDAGLTQKERAVIEAAKAWVDSQIRHYDEALASSALYDAVEALEKAEGSEP